MTTTAEAMECGYAWGERQGADRTGHLEIHHDCAEPEGHDGDHVCGTCGRSKPNERRW